MNKAFCFLILSIILIFSSAKVKATHAAGGEIIYEWVSDSTYRIYFRYYRDCSGIKEPDSLSLCIRNNCVAGWDTSIELNKTLSLYYFNGQEIYQDCPTAPSYCNGGTLPGFREWWYERLFTFPYQCNSWILSHSDSVRDALRNFPSGSNLYIEATFDNLHAQGSSSPYFSVLPIPNICSNSPFAYNPGGQDTDNDSLNFEMLTPRSGGDCTPVPMTFSSGYSLPSNPISTGGTFNFNNTTGQISFTAVTIGQYALAERINKYRFITGLGWTKIGSIMRDMEILILPCTNKQPTLSLIGSTLSGASSSSGIINACVGETFSFCFDAKSSDTNSVLIARDNGALFYTTKRPMVSYSHSLTDSVRGCFSWTPGPTDTGLRIFCVSIKDSACKGVALAGTNIYSIPIYVSSATAGSVSKSSICRGDSVVLNATGAGSYTWSVVPGGSLTSSIGCIICATTVAKPIFTTSYVVTGTGGKPGCHNTDTITVSVNAMPAKPTITTDSILCAGDSLMLREIETTAGVTYKWSGPSGYSSTLASPTILFPTQGKYKLTVANGACAVADSFNLKIVAASPSPSVYVTTIPPGDKYTAGDYVLFTANATNTVPSTTYQWERNGIVIPGATNSKYLTNTLSEHDVITVLVRNNMSCSGVDSAIGSTFPLSISSVSASEGVHVFPNPTTGSFTITAAFSFPNDSHVGIEVANTLGQTVFKDFGSVANGQLNKEIHLANAIPNGIYFLRVVSGNTFWVTSFSVAR